MSNCPLCQTSSTSDFSADQFRSYRICAECKLIYVPRSQLISPEAEKKRYDSHQNSAQGLGYQRYLSQIAELLIPQLASGSRGLDFGCGSSTLMADIFGTRGFFVDSYDLYYHRREIIWEQTFDFIILSEVIEHLRDPLETMLALKTRLKPGGSFFIKTALAPESKEDFDLWFYKRDSTHVQFFQLMSLEILLERLQMSSLKVLAKDLFQLHH